MFAVLADDSRRAIVESLADAEATVGELTSRFRVSQPAMSRHLRILRDHRLVHARRDGRRRVYAIDPNGFRDIDSWLEPYRAFWGERLASLNEFLDNNPE